MPLATISTSNGSLSFPLTDKLIFSLNPEPRDRIDAPTTHTLVVEGDAVVILTGLTVDHLQLLQFQLCELKERHRAAAQIAERQAKEVERIGLRPTVTQAECDGGLAVG